MAQIRCESKAILPAQFNVNPAINAIPQALRQAAARMLEDFESTAANWEHKPTFTLTTRGKDTISITTTDENWIRIDQGTQSKGYVLARKGPSGKRAFKITKRRPKSKPGVIRSSGGGPTGEVRYRASYQHKGITPRRFTETIANKYARDYPALTATTIEHGVAIGISAESREVKVKTTTPPASLG